MFDKVFICKKFLGNFLQRCSKIIVQKLDFTIQGNIHRTSLKRVNAVFFLTELAIRDAN